ncbi:TPA: TetR/AcrR family transcriptional regulator [Klebsiella michiganensis]|uniref:TetR/AcrR family transcriptional regulator n=1 Tax=Enterobacter hormaechei TaxID=158836 RepID=UPI0039082FC7|nr:TetR/AcrR family transcriptional regulator [Enterobacter hormaechei subsp. steigerwaltii]HAV1583965.1 TetR/AcrR family transcriptional regulator [Enterobacter hormaechei subsp. steigerwaltii]HAV1867095.1 TetR/AcrR family transcriptional regulator [Enterobacter hormaechei subsp. steigerwaltii]
MSDLTDPDTGLKSKDRRKQVLDAAAKCFSELGFHGCSIAKISKAASMSPGHIYYHFANKEEIVEALVSHQESTLYELINEIAASPPDERIAVSLKRHTKRMVEVHTSPNFNGLWLEIAAEAARNPGVAEILQTSHDAINARFHEELFKRARTNSEVDMQKIRTGMDIIASIFSGLTQHTATRALGPEWDKQLLINMINEIIECFFGEY